MEIPVKLYKDGTADPDPVELDMANGDTILWSAEEEEVTVEFVGDSPFKDKKYKVAKKKTEKSGKIRDDAKKQPYEYGAKAAGMEFAADPTVIVR